jgi:hypothetical protein
MSAPAIPTIPATVDAGNTIVPGSTQVVLPPGTDLGTLFATFLSSLPNNTVLPGYVAADGTVPIGTGTGTVMVDTASSARTGNASAGTISSSATSSAVTPSTSRVTNMTTPTTSVTGGSSKYDNDDEDNDGFDENMSPTPSPKVRNSFTWKLVGSNQPLPDVPVETCPDAARPTEYTAYVLNNLMHFAAPEEGLLWTIMRANGHVRSSFHFTHVH